MIQGLKISFFLQLKTPQNQIYLLFDVNLRIEQKVTIQLLYFKNADLTHHMQDIKIHFKKLASHRKDLLKALAIIDSPQPRNKILQICNKSSISDRNERNFTIVSIADELEFLKASSFLKKTMDQKYQIYPHAFDFILRQTLKDKRLKKLRKSTLEALPGMDSRSSYNRTAQAVLRDLGFALYRNDFKTFTQAKEYAIEHYDIKPSFIYQTYFVERLGKDNIAGLSVDFQLEFYQSNLKQMLFKLENIDSPMQSLMKHQKSIKQENRLFLQQCSSLDALMKGDWDKVQEMWSNNTSIDALRFIAWMHFAKGNNRVAIEFYDKALQSYRQEKGSRKVFFKGFHGAIFILALLKDDNQKHLPQIKKYFKELFATGAPNVFILLRAAIESLQANNEYAQEIFQQEYIYYNIDGLLYLYVQKWTNTFAPNWEKYAHTLHFKALKSGYYWIAYNIATLMTQVPNDRQDFYHKTADQLRTKLNNPPTLLEVIAVKESWEKALSALEQLNDQSFSPIESSGNRLIWLVDFDKGILIPKIQKINKSGKWSKGRNASLSKLALGDIEEASPHDSRIANTLSYESNWNGHNSMYAFNDLDKAFKALVGHPLLFLYKSPEIGCELQLGNPELMVTGNDEGYTLSASTDLSQVGYSIVKETPTRYKYLEISTKQVQLYQAMGGHQLNIPNKGRQKLEKTLKSLANFIPLQSDLDFQDESLPEVAVDARIYIHLLPVGDGFHVEMLVKPFQSCPPYYRPGEGPSRVVAIVESVKSYTLRNLNYESSLAKQIIDDCPILDQTPSYEGLWQFETPDNCLQLLRDLEPLKSSDKIVIEWPKGEKIKIKQHIHFDHLKITIKKDNDWFGLSGSIQVNENLILDMRHMISMMQHQKSEFIELDDGQFLALSTELRKQLNMIDKFTDENGRMNQLAGFAFDSLSERLENIQIDDAWKEHLNRLKNIETKQYSIPSDLKAELRGYQKEGYQWLSKLSDWGVGACLADDMGLGKTVQALAIILERSTEGPSLVVAPASVCRNWIKEIDKFAPSLRATLFGENNREKTIATASAKEVLVCTYGLLQSESQLFAEKKFTTIVLDEAQAIKNNTAKRSKAAMKLQGNFKIITTGTPIENHLGELWNLFRFINPGLLGNSKWFRNRFALPIEKEKDLETQEQLQHLIKPFILRRNKRDVLKELPPKTEVILSVQLPEKEKAFYEALRKDALDHLKNNGEVNAGTKHLKVLAQLMRLRRACCSPRLVHPETDIKGAKLELFGKTILEITENGHKALVFSQFVGHLKIIEEYVKEQGIPYHYLDGQTPTKKRQERIDAFQAGSGKLFLISLKAGGTGLNLTAADYVIHMDPWWNPAVEDQASDRAHRIGQTRPVTVYRLITENTIEEKIIKLHENKRELADSLLKGTDASSKLTADDLLDLIKSH